MRTLEAVVAALPNGLHDARLRSLHLDYTKAEAVFVLDALVSTPESSVPSDYRSLQLTVHGLVFASIDVPASAALGSGKPLRIDAGPGQPSTAPSELPELPEGCFLHWLFVDEWNGFIRLAGRGASYRWLRKAC